MEQTTPEIVNLNDTLSDNPNYSGGVAYATSDQDKADALVQAVQDSENVSLGDYGEGILNSIKSDWVGSWAIENLTGENFEPDLEWAVNVDPEFIKEQLKDVPPEYHEYFEQATSEAHFQALKDRMSRDLEMEEEMARLGWSGVGIRMLTSMLDPVAIGATILTEGVAAPLVYGTKLTKLGRIARGAAVGGLTNAGLESINVNYKPTGDWVDVVYAGLMGGAAGAVTGGMFKGTPIERKLDGALIKTGREVAAKAAELRQRSSGVIPESNLKGSTAGAKQAGDVEYSLSDEEFEDLLYAKEQDRQETVMGKVHWGVGAQMLNSKNPFVHEIGRKFLGHSVGAKEGTSGITAFEEAQNLNKRFHTDFSKAAVANFTTWRKNNGIGWYKQGGAWRDFMREVTAAYRGKATYAGRSVSNEAKQVAEATRKLFSDWAQLAGDPGLLDGKQGMKALKGFEEAVPNPDYMPRIFHKRNVIELSKKHSPATIQRLIRQAITDAQPQMDAKLAERLSKLYYEKIATPKYAEHDGMSISMAFSGEDADQLREIMKEAKFSDSEVEAVLQHFRGKGDSNKLTNSSKKRTLLNEGAQIKLDNGEILSFTDLLVDDMDQIFTMYNRKMAGAVAMARQGITSRSDWDDYVQNAKRVYSENAVEGYSQGEIDNDLKNLQYTYNAIMGVPNYDPNNPLARWAKIMRDMQFVRVMNTVGLANLPEIFQVVGQYGASALYQAVPSLRAMIRNKNLDLRTEFGRELEMHVGTGTDVIRHLSDFRNDDLPADIVVPDAAEGIMGKIEDGLRWGKRVTLNISGFSAINTFNQRWAAASGGQRFADAALGKIKITEKGRGLSKRRLRDLGIDDAMWERIASQIKKHSTTSGRRVRQLGLDNWDDTEAYHATVMALDRWGRLAVQETDPGNMTKWMSHPMGMLLTQFRGFMLTSWMKQTLKGAHVRDFNAWAGFMASLFGGIVTYIAQTHLFAIGREDRERYLEERLQPQVIFASGFQRAGFSSIMPSIADTTLQLFNHDPIFSYGRTTNLSNDMLSWQAYAAGDHLAKGVGAVQGILSSAVDGDYDFSQENARDLIGILPLQNALPLRWLTNYALEGLPERSE